MALSPNYSWSEPDNSSLVKNGAADIRTLGDAIDTSVWNVGFGQAAKNKVINGDFTINQRNFTSTTTSGTYGHDRWNISIAGDGTVTYSNQTFTAGAAPVAGYEAKQYARVVTASQTTAASRSSFSQPIENVRTFAGQTATISFWAKAATGTPKIATELGQFFGSGGSPSSGVYTYAGQTTISTSWARYSVTVAVPSISGKTVGTTDNTSQLALQFFFSAGSNFDARTGSLGIQNNTIDIWGVQMEYGSKATPFQTATGTIQGELAACQRYYWRFGGSEANERFGTGQFSTTTVCNVIVQNPVPMRVNPTSIDFSTLAVFDGSTSIAATNATIASATKFCPIIQITVASGGTVNRAAQLLTNNSTSGYLGLSAEL